MQPLVEFIQQLSSALRTNAVGRLAWVAHAGDWPDSVFSWRRFRALIQSQPLDDIPGERVGLQNLDLRLQFRLSVYAACSRQHVEFRSACRIKVDAQSRDPLVATGQNQR